MAKKVTTKEKVVDYISHIMDYGRVGETVIVTEQLINILAEKPVAERTITTILNTLEKKYTKEGYAVQIASTVNEGKLLIITCISPLAEPEIEEGDEE